MKMHELSYHFINGKMSSPNLAKEIKRENGYKWWAYRLYDWL